MITPAEIHRLIYDDDNREQIEVALKRRRDALAALDILRSGPMRDTLGCMHANGPDGYDKLLDYIAKRAGLK